MPNMERQLFLFNKLHQRLLCSYQDFNKLIDFNLTKRENEILYYSSMGKTYKEISVLTNITEYTVKFHMAKIVNKLNATNARHAIKIASDLKLIYAL